MVAAVYTSEYTTPINHIFHRLVAHSSVVLMNQTINLMPFLRLGKAFADSVLYFGVLFDRYLIEFAVYVRVMSTRSCL